ncbi:hypothetical protein PAPYR_9490 [Paratrimastix pyriformis]|uniref:Fibronectin type-III domain-containing protein n=1 Tax=Paratrimastix pyriformis TaxID=342808 RepID=A0ABQ8U898_9EUKA|nr:hypothetical protein PAPYR_9490 [Paratrimastix pyriformis]
MRAVLCRGQLKEFRNLKRCLALFPLCQMHFEDPVMLTCVLAVADVERHLGASCECRAEECDGCHQPMPCSASTGRPAHTSCLPRGQRARHEHEALVAHLGWTSEELKCRTERLPAALSEHTLALAQVTQQTHAHEAQIGQVTQQMRAHEAQIDLVAEQMHAHETHTDQVAVRFTERLAKTAEHVRQLHQDHIQAQADLATRSDQAMDELRQRLERTTADLAATTDLLAQSRRSHAEDLDRIAQTHSHELAATRLNLAAQIAESQKVASDELAKARLDFAEQLVESKNAASDALATTRQQHERELAQATEQMRAHHEAQLAQVAQQMRVQAQAHEAQLAQVTTATARLARELASTVQALADHHRADEEAHARLEERMARAQQSHQEHLAAQMAITTKRLDEAATKEELAQARQRAEAGLAAHREQTDTAMAGIIARLDREQAATVQALADHHRANEEAHARLEERMARDQQSHQEHLVAQTAINKDAMKRLDEAATKEDLAQAQRRGEAGLAAHREQADTAMARLTARLDREQAAAAEQHRADDARLRERLAKAAAEQRQALEGHSKTVQDGLALAREAQTRLGERLDKAAEEQRQLSRTSQQALQGAIERTGARLTEARRALETQSRQLGEVRACVVQLYLPPDPPAGLTATLIPDGATNGVAIRWNPVPGDVGSLPPVPVRYRVQATLTPTPVSTPSNDQNAPAADATATDTITIIYTGSECQCTYRFPETAGPDSRVSFVVVAMRGLTKSHPSAQVTLLRPVEWAAILESDKNFGYRTDSALWTGRWRREDAEFDLFYLPKLHLLTPTVYTVRPRATAGPITLRLEARTDSGNDAAPWRLLETRTISVVEDVNIAIPLDPARTFPANQFRLRASNWRAIDSDLLGDLSGILQKLVE